MRNYHSSNALKQIPDSSIDTTKNKYRLTNDTRRKTHTTAINRLILAYPSLKHRIDTVSYTKIVFYKHHNNRLHIHIYEYLSFINNTRVIVYRRN